jgi:type II secretory pathway predicted ATPase ExeA
MYEAFFGLNQRPFPSAPQVEHYFPASAIESARQMLVRCVQRAEGAGMVVGPSGTGKTLLCHLLVQQFHDTFRTVFLANGRLGTRRSLLQAILHGLGQPYRGMDEGELRLALVDYLSVVKNCPNGMLLLIDEAHTLPLKLLDELRVVADIVAGGQLRTRLVLVGGNVLEERFTNPRLESLSQRLVARCYLESFNRLETQDYIQRQVQKAGGAGTEIFPADTCHAVHQATDGVPRLVNQVCDHALILACTDKKRALSPAIIEQAWADLQQLPTPWSGKEKAKAAASGSTAGSTGVVEFGGLVDDEETASTGPAKGPAATDSHDAATPGFPMPDVSMPSAQTPGKPGKSTPDVPPLRVAKGTNSTSDSASGRGPLAGETADPFSHIEEMVSELADDFKSPNAAQPEIELVFEDPSSLLKEPFDEEEVVRDRYLAAMQRRRLQQDAGGAALSPPHAPRDTSDVEVVVPLASSHAAEIVAESYDDELVIEDDATRERHEPSPSLHAVPLVRKREYRLLFSQLQRGVKGA